jgi:hypothetical protein
MLIEEHIARVRRGPVDLITRDEFRRRARRHVLLVYPRFALAIVFAIMGFFGFGYAAYLFSVGALIAIAVGLGLLVPAYFVVVDRLSRRYEVRCPICSSRLSGLSTSLYVVESGRCPKCRTRLFSVTGGGEPED